MRNVGRGNKKEKYEEEEEIRGKKGQLVITVSEQEGREGWREEETQGGWVGA